MDKFFVNNINKEKIEEQQGHHKEIPSVEKYGKTIIHDISSKETQKDSKSNSHSQGEVFSQRNK